MLKHLFFIVLLSITLLSKAAVGPPVLRCVSVIDTLGSVQLSWNVPADPLNEFFSYHIFYSTSPGGPYTDIKTITVYSQTTYTHVAGNANNSSCYYFMVTHYGTNGASQSSSSDTLNTIFLSMTAQNQSIVTLGWNAIQNPQLALPFYVIYHSPPVFFVDSTKGLSYIDTVSKICDTTRLFYQVVVSDHIGCTSKSNSPALKLVDRQAPHTTSVVVVSVDTSTNIPIVTWKVNNTKDLNGYYILKTLGGLSNFYDTVPVNPLIYHDNTANAKTSSHSYAVSGFDFCNQPGGWDIPLISTVHLTGRLNVCNASVDVSWNPYKGFPLSKQEIYLSENQGPYILQQTFTGGSDKSFQIKGLTNHKTYKFFVRGYNNKGDLYSNSNSTDTIRFSTTSVPSFLNIISPSVDVATQKINLTWQADPNASLKAYKILRSQDQIKYDTIATANHVNGITQSFSDPDASPSEFIYYYKVVALDSCSNYVKTSDIGFNMKLSSEPFDNFSNTLNWNNFLLPATALHLHRSVNGVWESTTLSSLPGNRITYLDDVENFSTSAGTFCYYVESIGNTGNIGNSNISCIRQQTHIYVPNGFRPESGIEENKVFKPVAVFIDPANYKLLIYNRWGKKVFESNDPNKGWDGKSLGEDQPLGIYAYVLQYVDNNGVLFQKAGSITLIK